jgi:hypothetical protein
MKIKALAAPFGALALATCATVDGNVAKIVVQEVKVPVAVSCVPAEFPKRPSYADTKAALKAAPAVDERYHLMSSEWARRDARLAAVEDQVDICRKAGAAPAS